MNKTCLISVIVPVYNTEKYVGKCIESILNQSYQNFELIIVDDGSKDKSLSVCIEYSEDPRIKIISQKNQGVSMARNTGLDNANGDYVVFVDSDDEILPDMLSQMIKVSKKYNADLIMCGVITHNGLCGRKKIHYETNKVFKDNALLEEYLINRKNITPTIWAKMFRAKLFENVRFPVGLIYEDAYIMPLLFSSISRAVYVPECLYIQKVSGDSITRSAFSHKKLDSITCEEHLIEFVENNYPEYLHYVLFRKLEAMVSIMRKIILDKAFVENKKLYNEIKEKVFVEYERILLKTSDKPRLTQDISLALNLHFVFVGKYIVIKEMKKIKSKVKKMMIWMLGKKHEKNSM